MAYFKKATAERSWHKIEPRMLFILVWIFLYAVVLLLVLRGNIFTRITTPVTLPSAAVSPSIRVLVPKKAIPQGTRLIPELFSIEKRVIQGIEERVHTELDTNTSVFAATTIQAGSPLLKDFVTTTPPSNAVIAKIPLGFRAITISVTAESGVEGWVSPGARVDVVWISTVRNRQAVTTIVENAEVLSAEHTTEVTAQPQSEKSIPTHVTLKVLARDAQKIQLAKASGTLSLNLRGSADQLDLGNETITTDELIKKDDPRIKADSLGWLQVGDKKFDVNLNGTLHQRDTESESAIKSAFKE